MRKVIQNVNKIEKNPLKTADTVNYEGAKAWKKSNAEAIRQLMFTGTLQNTFYASQKDMVEQAVDVIKAASVENLYQAIIDGRNEGYIRTAPILGLVYLSEKDSGLFKKAFNEVVRTGNDLQDFLEMNKSVRGFGRAIKDAMKNWISTKTNPYYACKYSRQIADAIRITHYPCNKDEIFHYILGKEYGVNEKNEKLMAKAEKKYPALNAMKDVKLLLAEGDYDRAMELIDKYSLDVDSIIGIGKLPSKVWDSLGRSMPVMRFLKNIEKLTREGVLERNPNLYKEKITVENLKKAKVFPFRLYTAYQNITDTKVKNHLADVLNDYVTKFDWEVFNSKSWAICPDVSGSMTSKVRDSELKPSLVAGLFTGMLYKGLSDSQVIPWDTCVHPYRSPRADSVLTHIKNIENANGGGTEMNTPVEHLLKNKIKVDVFLGITDSEEWSRSRGGRGSRSWIEAWVDYKKFNPKAQAILIRVDGYNSNPFSDEQAKKYDIYQIYGFNDSCLNFMKFILG